MSRTLYSTSELESAPAGGRWSLVTADADQLNTAFRKRRWRNDALGPWADLLQSWLSTDTSTVPTDVAKGAAYLLGWAGSITWPE